MIVPYPIYLEVHKLVLRATGFQAAIAFSNRLAPQTNLLNPTLEDYEAALQFTNCSPDQRITIFDAVTAALAMPMMLPVWTYDFHFEVMRIAQEYLPFIHLVNPLVLLAVRDRIQNVKYSALGDSGSPWNFYEIKAVEQ